MIPRLLATLTLPLLIAAAQAPAGEKPTTPAIVQDYEPRPAIWSLSDEDTTIYLFGTIHALPSGFKWRSPALNKVIAEVDELVVETVESEEEDKLLEAFFMGAINMERPPLVERVPEDRREALKALMTELKTETEMLDTMPTWFAAFGLAVQMIEGGEDEFELGADTTLENEFEQAGRPVSSIEEFLPIMLSFNLMSEADQRAMLVDMLEEADASEMEDPMADTHLWAQGKLETLAEDLSEEVLGEQLYDILLRERNTAWTDWLADRLEEPGKVLVAVGTGHLAGEDSLQVMLKERGLEVKRVD